MSLMKEYTIKVAACFLAIVLLSILVLCSVCSAADLSTDPYDGSVENQSGADSSAAEGVSGPVASGDDSSASAGSAEMEIEPDYSVDESDVVVNRAQLQQCIDLLNDLSQQLALYAADVPAGYEPSEDDLAYRADLLLTLVDIRDSLLTLTEPEPVEEESLQEETIPEEESAPVEPSRSSGDVSEPVQEPERDPADASDYPGEADSSASVSTEDNSISQQDFYKLVLGFLFLLCLWPVLTWVYRFLSSFIPV